ncbi:unnamed protein product, partial [Gulo gulo]
MPSFCWIRKLSLENQNTLPTIAHQGKLGFELSSKSSSFKFCWGGEFARQSLGPPISLPVTVVQPTQGPPTQPPGRPTASTPRGGRKETHRGCLDKGYRALSGGWPRASRWTSLLSFKPPHRLGARHSYCPRSTDREPGRGEANAQVSDQRKGRRSGTWAQRHLAHGSLLLTGRWDSPRLPLQAAPPWGLSQPGHVCYTPLTCAITISPDYITRGRRGLCQAGWAARGGGGGLCPSQRGLPWTPRRRAFPTPTPSPIAT